MFFKWICDYDKSFSIETCLELNACIENGKTPIRRWSDDKFNLLVHLLVVIVQVGGG